MGGNAFQDTVRMQSKQEFERVFQDQLQLFSSIKLPMIVPAQIKTKDSFGDMDIIIPTAHGVQIRQILDEQQLPYKVNGIVTSYLTPERHQIDLIAIKPVLMDYATHYFAHGDCGNILGRMIKKNFRLKNSFNGLYYVYRQDNDSYSKEFLLSLKYKDLIDMLELDWQKFKAGFETNHELFDWVYACPYLDTDSFKLENLNHTNRVRDRKRKFYREWLEYLADKPKKPTKTPKPLSAYFSDFDEQYRQIDGEYATLKAFKAKFNGNVVKTLTGFEGKQLGEFMAYVTDRLSKDTILNLSQSDLESTILSLYYDYSHNLSN